MGDVNDASLFDDNGPFTQVKNKRKKSKKLGMLQNRGTTSSMIDEVLRDVASQRSLASPPCTDRSTTNSPPQNEATRQPDDNNSTSELELSVLRKTIQDLTTVVDKLFNQLNFVLSYLDISDVADIRPVTTKHPSSAVEVAAEDISTSSTAAVGGTTAVTYSGVAAVAPAARGAGPRPTSLKEAVVTAVHVDQRDRERRARTVVVSGLMQQNSMTDADCFRRLTMLELGVDPAIKFTRRLGVAADGRVQRLLVGLQSADQAANLIQRAKQLRSSSDEHVRTSVYINRNLTAVEAKLAYEERCRRRSQMSQPRRSGRQHYTGDQQSQSFQAVATSQTGRDLVQPHSSVMSVGSYQRHDLQQHSDGGAGVNDLLSVPYSRSSMDNQREGGLQLTNNDHQVSGCSLLSVPLPGRMSSSAAVGVNADGRHR